MLGVEGLELTAADRERLAHPLAGGAILFTRNFASPAQLDAPDRAIHALRDPPLLIAVDHEGGRVQRFRDGFTPIPAMRTLGRALGPRRCRGRARGDRASAGRSPRNCARAASISALRRCSISTTARAASSAIARFTATRMRSRISRRRSARGLRAGGMAAVGKHFPGHGFVAADSHEDAARRRRGRSNAIAADDLVPFAALVKHGLAGDHAGARRLPGGRCASRRDIRASWLQEILRGAPRLRRLVFSDDLGMAGAAAAGDIVARADAAHRAGCDLVLACNDMAASDDLLERWKPVPSPELARRAESLAGRTPARRPS